MATVYNGIAANIVPPSPVAISGISIGGGPITVTTSTAHGLTNGDTVDITGVSGNAGTNVNGIFAATVTGGATFTIPVASSGTWTSGGTVQSVAVGAVAAIPTPGDAGTAVSVDTMFKRLSDQTAFLGEGTGYFKLAGRVVFTSPAGTGWASVSTTLAPATWTAMTLSTITPQSMETGCASVVSATGPYGIDGIKSVDVVHVELQTQFVQSTSTNPKMSLFYGIVGTGFSAPSFGASSQILNCACASGNPATTIDTNIHMSGWIPHQGTGVLYIQPAIYSFAGGATTASLIDETVLSVSIYRLTSQPQ